MSLDLALIGTALALLISFGSVIAMRGGYNKEARGLQSQTIDALRSRVDVLESEIEQAKDHARRDKAVLNTIRVALARRGLKIEINGEYIILTDEQTAIGQTTTIPIDQGNGDSSKKEKE